MSESLIQGHGITSLDRFFLLCSHPFHHVKIAPRFKTSAIADTVSRLDSWRQECEISPDCTYNFVNYYLRGIICKGTRSASSTDVLKCRIWLPCQFVDKLRCVCRHPKYPPLMYGTHLEVCILPNSEDLPSLRQSADRMMQFDRVLHCVHEPVFPP